MDDFMVCDDELRDDYNNSVPCPGCGSAVTEAVDQLDDGDTLFLCECGCEFQVYLPHYEDMWDEDEEDDGQPTEYEEWQDYMGGDDWDHGQYD